MAKLAAKFLCGRRQEEEPPGDVVLTEQEQVAEEKRTQQRIQLFKAIEKCDLTTIKELKREISFKDIKDKQGRTPLHVLADMKPQPGGKIKDEDITQIFNILINEGGCDINCVDEFGNTPVKLAAEKECTQVLTCLLENKADTEKADECKGDTPLHWAAKNGKLGSTNLLLKHGAHLNPQNKDQLTPLHLAVQYSHKTIVHILLLNGADKRLKEKNDFTPLDIAQRSGSTEIIALLKKTYKDLLKETKIVRPQGEHVEADSASEYSDTIPWIALNKPINVNYNVIVKDSATAAVGPNATVNEYVSSQEALPSPTAQALPSPTAQALPSPTAQALPSPKADSKFPYQQAAIKRSQRSPDVFPTAPPEED